MHRISFQENSFNGKERSNCDLSFVVNVFRWAYAQIDRSQIPTILEAGKDVDCSKAQTTFENAVCQARESEKQDAQLTLYYKAALTRISNDKTSTLLVSSQEAWLTYREKYCSSIYEEWSSGTMAGAMSSKCKSRMTKQRTHEIWEDYLTYMDSTPPVLPEP